MATMTQTLPSLVKEISQRKIDAYSVVRARSIHTDESWARAKGFRAPLAQGMMSTAYVSEMMTRFLGADIVRQQVDAGVDIVNDGEQGKVGYSTYVRHRLTGFGGTSAAASRADWADFPEAAARAERRSAVSRPACDGPIEWQDRGAVQKDVANLRAALDSVRPTEAFMTAASPGVIAHFLRNEYYPSREAYLARLVDVMKEEYDAIHRAGFVLQVDCPDLAMGRHLAFPSLSNAEFVKIAEANVEALNHALRDIPPDRMRLHLCWGNYEGPHHRDIPLREIIHVVLKARPQALSLEGANPRHEHEWVVFQEVRLPEEKVIIPGVLDSTTNFIEHPELVAQRLVRYAEVVGRERGIAGTDCGFATFGRSALLVEPEIAWAKFKSMTEGARLASQQLWR